MSDIDYESLLFGIMDNIDDSLIDGYDFDIILQSAEPCWDNTAVQVKGKDFTMVFDNISYEILDYTGFDIYD